MTRYIVLTLLVLVSLLPGAEAALTHDTNRKIPTGVSTTTTSAASDAYTCGANAKLLVVMVCYAGVTQRTGGAPTYNSVALTQVESLAGVTEAACELWYMLSPPVSQALTVTVPNGNGVTMWVYVASANAGSGKGIALDDTGITETTGANPTVNVSTANAGCIIYAVCASGDNGFNPSAQTGTELYNDDLAGYGSACQYYVMAGTGSQSIVWTEATSDDYGALAAAFYEVNAYSETVNDSEGITDARTTIRTVALTMSESLGITDARTLVRNVVLVQSESMGITDTQTGFLNQNDFSQDANCVAVWNLESSSLIVDSKGTNTLTNSSVDEDTGDYKQGACSGVWVAANTDLMSITDVVLNSGMPLKSGESNKSFSFTFWLKLNSVGVYQTIFDKGSFDEYEELVRIAVTSSNRLIIYANTGGSYTNISHITTMVTDRWYHCAVTCDGNVNSAVRIRIWDDTAQAILGEDKTGTVGTIPITTDTYRLGVNYSSANYLNGKLDEVVVFNRGLSVSEIDSVRQGKFPLSYNEYIETVNDALGLTDAQVLVRVVVRAFDESMGVSDARDKVSEALRTLAEALGITDEQIASQGHIRAISDSLGLTDAWTEAEIKVIADALGMTDESLRMFIILRTLEETLAITDSTSAVRTAIRTVVDSLGLTDDMLALKSQEKIIVDALGITDDAARLYVGLRTVDDALGLTDEVTKVNVLVKVISDSLGLTDTRTVLYLAIRTPSDDLGLTDTMVESKGWNRTLNNNVGLTDDSAEEEGKVLVESLGLVDTMICLSVALRTMADSLNITDAMDYESSGGFVRTVSDSLGLTDTRVLVKTVVRSFDNPMGITDNQTKVSETVRTISNGLDLTDTRTTSIGVFKTFDNSLGLADNRTLTVNVVRTVDDLLGITDERTLLVMVVRTFDDSLGITDAMGSEFSGGFVRIVNDSLGLTDEASRVSVFILTVSDSEDLTDVVSELLVPGAVGEVVSRPHATSIVPFISIFMRSVLDDPNAAAVRVSLGVLEWIDVPTASNSPGSPGQIAYDASYFYICVAENTWKRLEILTWP